jgi:hypothetical protein
MKTNNPLHIQLPDDWDDRTVHTFMGPDDSGVQHLLTLVVDPEVVDDNVSDYARQRIDTLMDSLQGAEILKAEERTLPGGNCIYECVYKWVPSKDKPIFQKVVYLIAGGTGYTFSANFSKKTIKTIGVEVERMIDSFRPAGMLEEDE